MISNSYNSRLAELAKWNAGQIRSLEQLVSETPVKVFAKHLEKLKRLQTHILSIEPLPAGPLSSIPTELIQKRSEDMLALMRHLREVAANAEHLEVIMVKELKRRNMRH
jgi:hypothetical protein